MRLIRETKSHPRQMRGFGQGEDALHSRHALARALSNRARSGVTVAGCQSMGLDTRVCSRDILFIDTNTHFLFKAAEGARIKV